MDCYNRNQESARLWRHFMNEKDVLMLAPRRIGKTVLLNRLSEESEENGFRAIVLDVEGYREEKDFFRQMCSAIQEETQVGNRVLRALTNRLRRLITGTENQGDWRSILLSIDWSEFADHLLAQLEADKDGRPWLILVDEIPIFTKALLEAEGPDRARDFLYTLRNLSQKHRKVRWLFTGSIGLDVIARRHNFEGALVDMEVEPLEPFARETAAGFVAHLAVRREAVFSAEAVDAILDRLGWLSPYYIEKIVEAACDLASPGEEVTVALANQAADSMLELARRTYWATWREHLDKNFPEPERTRLFTIINEIARTEEGASIDTLLLALGKGEPIEVGVLRGDLDTLEADGYLTADPDRTRFRFRMNLLREWWLRYVAPPRTRG